MKDENKAVILLASLLIPVSVLVLLVFLILIGGFAFFDESSFLISYVAIAIGSVIWVVAAVVYALYLLGRESKE